MGENMDKWEYCSVDYDNIDEYGLLGWEAYAIITGESNGYTFTVAYMKRRL